MTTKYIFLYVILVCFSISNASWGQTEIAIENIVPHDCGLVLSVENPSALLTIASEQFQVDEAEFIRLCDRILQTNLVDATDLDGNSTSNDLNFLTDAASVHFVLENSRKQVGAFGILIEMSNQSNGITKDSLVPLVKVGSFLLRRFLVDDSKIGGELDTQIAKFESGFQILKVQNWVLITHSHSLEKYVTGKVNGEELGRPISSMRAFNVAKKEVLTNAIVKCYLSPRHLTSLSSLLRIESTGSNELDEIPWAQLSIGTEESSSSFKIKQLTAFGRTSPASGKNRYWDLYLPIEEFPDVDLGDWQRVAGSCVDQSKWNRQYLSDVNKVMGKEAAKNYADDPVSSFINGFSRESLGNLMLVAEMANGAEQSWYAVKPDMRDRARQEVSKYFTGMDANYRNAGYQTVLDDSKKDVWQLEVVDAQDEPGSDSLDGFGSIAPKKMSRQPATVPSKSWARKYATIFGNWFVIGSRDAVIKATKDPEKNETIKETVLDCLKTFSVQEHRPHSFRVFRPKALARSMQLQVATVLNGVFGFSWRLSNKAFAKVCEQGIKDSKLTNPQAIGFFVKKILDKVEKRRGSYVRLELVLQNHYVICQEIEVPKKQD
jgi:hypothetical protein